MFVSVRSCCLILYMVHLGVALHYPRLENGFCSLKGGHCLLPSNASVCNLLDAECDDGYICCEAPVPMPRPIAKQVAATCSSQTQDVDGESGSISVWSENNYENNLDCQWRITVDAGKVILIEWVNIDIEDQSTCDRDYVEIMGQKFCGSVMPDSFTSPNKQVLVKFHTDDSIQKKGFSLRYSFISKPRTGCKDNRKSCEEWSQRGECKRNPEWMLINCKKSCGLCDDTSCKDYHITCKIWSQSGVCKNHPAWMSINCKKSCGLCVDRSCKDNDNSCKKWSQSGECKKHPRWMLINCKKSCDACDGIDDTSCKDSGISCKVWSQSGWCKNNPDWMNINCKRSCGLCDDINCGVVNSQTRIMGGKETLVHEYPWQVALVGYGGSQPFCGGSIISSRWILTAAYCLSSVITTDFQVLVGEHDWSTTGETTFTVRANIEQVVMHSSYINESYDNDIGLIKLNSDLTFTQSNRVAPVCLPPVGTQDQFEDVDAIVSGWGTLTSEGSQPNILNDVTVPTMTNAQCQPSYESHGYSITDNMICAGLPEGGKDSCQGDSGGPMVTEADDGHMIQIGVVSWGIGCALPGYPGVYARVSNYITWILGYVNGA